MEGYGFQFPSTSIIATTERDFLHLHTPESVLKMIKDGSYDGKLSAFLNIGDPPSKDGYVYIQELFQKELTQSDVGQRKGLVIPKKDAEEFFPKMKNGGITGEEKGVLLRFLDGRTNRWTDFRYNFYRSSQSYVLTTGWSKYVKANELKEKDVVKFYECVREYGERYVMIDVEVNGARHKEELMEVEYEEICAREKGVWLFGVLIG